MASFFYGVMGIIGSSFSPGVRPSSVVLGSVELVGSVEGVDSGLVCVVAGLVGVVEDVGAFVSSSYGMIGSSFCSGIIPVTGSAVGVETPSSGVSAGSTGLPWASVAVVWLSASPGSKPGTSTSRLCSGCPFGVQPTANSRTSSKDKKVIKNFFIVSSSDHKLNWFLSRSFQACHSEALATKNLRDPPSARFFSALRMTDLGAVRLRQFLRYFRFGQRPLRVHLQYKSKYEMVL